MALGARQSAFLFAGGCATPRGTTRTGSSASARPAAKCTRPWRWIRRTGGRWRRWCWGPTTRRSGRTRTGASGAGTTGGSAARRRPRGRRNPWILRYTGPEGQPITKMALGGDHTAFLAGGNTYVMGSNDFGQLGLGAAPDGACAPPNVTAPRRLTIRRGARDLNVTNFVLGYAHSAFFAAGRWYMSGRNNAGQLGLGDNADACAPRPLAVVTFNAFGAPLAAEQPLTAVALGDRHSAVVVEGRVFVMSGELARAIGAPV